MQVRFLLSAPHKNRIAMRFFSYFIITKTTLLFLKAFTNKVNASFFTPYIASLLLSFFSSATTFLFISHRFTHAGVPPFRKRSRFGLICSVANAFATAFCRYQPFVGSSSPIKTGGHLFCILLIKKASLSYVFMIHYQKGTNNYNFLIQKL